MSTDRPSLPASYDEDLSREPDYDDERDYWQEYKDGVATGQLNPDGSQREPGEPDFAAGEYERHCEEAHGGEACDCPPDDSAWELPEGAVYDTDPPF